MTPAELDELHEAVMAIWTDDQSQVQVNAGLMVRLIATARRAVSGSSTKPSQ